MFAVWVGVVWWGCAMLVLFLSIIAALCFPWPRHRRVATALPPVTAIVPIKEWDAHFNAAQASLFAQAYPDIEILVAAAEQDSPALAAARDLQHHCANEAWTPVWSREKIGLSPKLNNLWMAVAQARHDLILTKDSNVLLSPGDVESFVREMTDGVGLVSTVPIAKEPQSAAAWIEASIINCCYARMLMLGRMFGLGFGCGKIMLFRRSDIERFGGLQSLAWALGEDAALAQAIARLGSRVVLADRVSVQPLGLRRLRDVWERQLRWKAIWRVQAPLVFVGSLFTSAFVTALAGALAAPALGLSPWVVAAGTLGVWFLSEVLLSLLKGWPVSLWSAPLFIAREVLGLLVWLRAATTSQVPWAGTKYRLGRPESLGFSANVASGVPQEAGANDAL